MAEAAGQQQQSQQQEDGTSFSVPLTPPPDCIRVTPDGGVLKHVVEAGAGEPPVRHGRCLVHYEGRCVPSGEMFMSTKDESASGEPILVIAGRDAAVRETGLFLAVATMLPGERAAVYVTDPAYGYGEKGSFSFPSVPPACQLVYDVTMLTWEQPDEERERRTMFFEERLEAAERRRLDGNTLFAARQYKEALAKYALALSYCDEDFMLQLQGIHLDKAEAVTDPVLLNMAAAQLKLGDFTTAAHNATQILMRHPKNVKALFRRAKARAGLNRTEEALEDLTVAAALDPDDKQIARELRALKGVIKEEQAATAKLFKGSLGPAPKAKPDGGGGGTTGSSSKAAAAVDDDEALPLEPQPAAAAGQGSSSRGESRGLLHALFAALAAFLAWLWGLLAWGHNKPHAA